MSRLLSVFRGSNGSANPALRGIFVLMILVLASVAALLLIDPVNSAVFKFLNTIYPYLHIEKIIVLLLIFSSALSFYSIRKWKQNYDEVKRGKRVEEKLRGEQKDFEERAKNTTNELQKVSDELENKNYALEMLNTITRSVYTSLDIEKVCETAIEMSTTLEYVDTACIYLVDELGENAVLKYHSKNLPASFIKRASVIKKPDGVTWKVINTGEVVTIENIDENQDIGPASEELNHGSLLGLPIKIEEKNAGVIWFAGKLERKFTESEIDLLTSLSSHLSIALTRANVYRELYKKNRYETLINSVSKLVHGSINLEEVLDNAVEALSVNIIKAQNVSIYLVEGDNAVLKSYRGYKEDFLKKVAVIPYKKGITWKAILDKKPIYCDDSENDVVLGEAGKEMGTKSYVSMPIMSGHHVVGVININSLSKNAFDAEELKLLEIVSSQIQNAINNAKYAEALRKSEELLWQKISQLSSKSKYESIIRSIIETVHGSLDLQEILENTVTAIKEKIDNVDFVALHIVEYDRAVLKAERGLDKKSLDILGVIPSPKGPVWKTMSQENMVYCPDITIEEKDQEVYDLNVKSYVTVPLFEKDDPVGTIFVGSFEQQAFNNDDLYVLEIVTKQIETAITNARQAETLINSENRYRTLFEESPLGVYIYNKDFIITNCNDRMTQIINTPKENIIGLDMNLLTDQKFFKAMERGLEGEIVQHEGFYEATTSSSKLWLSISFAPLRNKDQDVIGAMALVEDRTDVRKASEQITTAQRLESLGILAGGIAHDFNNILTAILGSISLAKYYETENKDLLGILTDAESASNRAKELTHQLLTFARGGEPVTKLVDIGKVVNESSAFALTGSNIRLDFNIPNDIWFVEADEGQLNQVFNNLVINAQQSMPDGGHINISLENFTDISSTLDSGKYIKISITDEGVGIPKQDIPKIFDPYFTTKNKGTGLGLSTTHSIIEKHGGYITIDSQVGRGSTFKVFLPASDDQMEDLKEIDEQLIQGSGSVLIMDDEKVIRDTVGSMLKRLGYDVSYSTDGEEAIDRYSSALNSDEKYDAVILDLTVPGGMGGKQAISKLIELDPDIKAIVSSGYSNNPVMSDYKNYGFSGILSKPYTLSQLSKVLDQIVS